MKGKGSFWMLNMEMSKVGQGSAKFGKSHLTNIAPHTVKSLLWQNEAFFHLDESANVVLFEHLSSTKGNATGTLQYSAELFGGVAGLILRKRLSTMYLCSQKDGGKKAVFNLNVCKLCLCFRALKRTKIH